MNWATNTTELHIPPFVHLSTRGLLELHHLQYEGLRKVDHILERKWRGRSHIGRAPNTVFLTDLTFRNEFPHLLCCVWVLSVEDTPFCLIWPVHIIVSYYTGCFKKSFTTLKAYRNLYRGHTQRFELSKCSKTHRVLPRIVMVQCDFHW